MSGSSFWQKIGSIDQVENRPTQRLISVCMVYLEQECSIDSNVCYLMVKEGYARVYQGKGSQYGGILEDLLKAEATAKSNGMGIWEGKYRFKT